MKLARRPGSAARWGLVLQVLALASAAAPGAGCEVNNQGYEPQQPIEYSHAVHAGRYQIPCQYCHFGAERSRHAGIPPASVCMNCHSRVLTTSPAIQAIARAVRTDQPIRWVRVHRLPDFVYFNHSWHVQQGVACQTCHGPVQEMARVRQDQPLTMGWCVSCHRQRNARLAGDAGVIPASQSERAASIDCAACHY